MSDPRLGLKEKLSYGLGEMASNLSWAMVSSFLLYFYTNVALLPVAALGTLFLGARILDAFADPMIGALMDRTRTRFGKARPYLLYGCVPFAVLSVLTFVSPDIGDQGKLVYAYVTFILLGLGFSALNIPYSAMMPMMTLDPDARMQLGSLRVVGSQVGSILVTALTMPLVAILGGSDPKRGFVLTIALMSALGTALYLVVFANCKERYAMVAPRRGATLATLRDMLRNRAWLVTSGFILTGMIRLGVIPAATVFYAQEVLKKPWAASVLLPLLAVALLAGAGIAPPLFKRLGKRMGNIVTLFAAILLYGAMALLQAHVTAFIVAYFLAMTAMGLGMTSMFALTADAVDFHEWKFRSRPEGLLIASTSFGAKVGMAVGGAIVAYVLAWAGYTPTGHTEAARQAIAWVYLGARAALMLVQIACIAFYDGDGLHPLIVAELFARRSARDEA